VAHPTFDLLSTEDTEASPSVRFRSIPVSTEDAEDTDVRPWSSADRPRLLAADENID
jgi:hypothetical protein